MAATKTTKKASGTKSAVKSGRVGKNGSKRWTATDKAYLIYEVEVNGSAYGPLAKELGRTDQALRLVVLKHRKKERAERLGLVEEAAAEEAPTRLEKEKEEEEAPSRWGLADLEAAWALLHLSSGKPAPPMPPQRMWQSVNCPSETEMALVGAPVSTKEEAEKCGC